MNWKDTKPELKELAKPVEKAKASNRSTFESIYTGRVPSTATPSSRVRYQSMEAHPEYVPPLKDYNYKFDSAVQYREALYRVSAISKLNRR